VFSQRVWRSVFGLLAATLSFALIVPTAADAATTSAPKTSGGRETATGLIAKYAAGVSVSTPNGGFVGQAQLVAAGFRISNGSALGAGWHSLKFAEPVALVQAQAAATLLATQPSVVFAGVDHNLAPAAQAARPLSTSRLTASKSVGAVRNVRATDGWQASAPNTAAISVNWLKPISLGGGKLHGYRLQASIDGGNKVLYSVTQVGASTRARLTREVVAGQKLSIRVASVVRVDGGLRVGRFSSWVSASATTVPSVPKFISEPVATTTIFPRWQLLNGPETGGLGVSYQATASLNGSVVDTCSTDGDSCAFTKLEDGTRYSVALRATNSRGFANAFNPAAVADPLFQYQWALDKTHGINAESAWSRTTGQGVVVAVIDSGITEHPDLAAQLFRNSDGSVYGYDFVADAANAQDGDGRDANPMDPNAGAGWHGTHVSGIIAAAANDQGVIGVAPGAKLLEVRALGANGGKESDLISSLQWAAGIPISGVPNNLYPAKVVNLSLGFIASCDGATTAVLRKLYDSGVTVITAAGNDNSYATISYPGNCVPTINVGASGYYGDRADYSNFGLGVDISAPGGSQLPNSGAPMMPGTALKYTGLVLSTYNDGAEALGNANYGYEQGTSMAAPFVTGVVALIYAARPDFTPDQVWQAMKGTVTPWGSGTACGSFSASNGCGAGIINAGEALTWALSQPKK